VPVGEGRVTFRQVARDSVPAHGPEPPSIGTRAGIDAQFRISARATTDVAAFIDSIATG
jgi:hypothetical protein